MKTTPSLAVFLLATRLCVWFLVAGLAASEAWAGNLKVTYPATHTGWVLETPSGKIYVIDPGVAGEFYDTDATSGMGIGTYLRSQGITTVHGLVISHPHGDHYAAGVTLFQDFTVLELIDTGFNPNNNNRGGYDADFWNAFKASGASHRTGLRAGDILAWDPELTVKVIGPKDPFWTYEESGSVSQARYVNTNSLVLWVKHGAISYMFTGDITQPAQNYLRVNWAAETKDTAVFGVPHHGKYYYRDDFARMVGNDHPFVRIAVISESHTGQGPSADRYDEWEGAGLLMYAGDGNNRVTVTSTGSDYFLVEGTNPPDAKIFSVTNHYSHEPFFRANGSNSLELADSPDARVTRFGVSAWFRTEATSSGANRMIVGKGSLSGGAPGENLNYGIWMTPSGRIQAGFQTEGGADIFVTSADTYNDGDWHHAAVRYNQSVLQLYVDALLVGSVDVSAIPDSLGSAPIRAGGGNRRWRDHFVGDIDEVRVWNRAISGGEIWNAYHGGRVNLNGLVGELDMSCLRLDGASFFDVSSTPQLQLSRFILEARFRTTAPPPPSQVAMIVNKGGFGSDAAGENMNYGLWINSDGHLVGGFEALRGADHFATSSRTVNDGKWHTAVVSYDGSALLLTLDGVEIARTETAAQPDVTGAYPLRVGANSRGPSRYFTGDVSYVRVADPDIGTVYWSRLAQGPFQEEIPVPVIQGLSAGQSGFSVTVQRDTAFVYSLWRGMDLAGEEWLHIEDAVVTQPSADALTFTDIDPPAERAFYRVLIIRP